MDHEEVVPSGADAHDEESENLSSPQMLNEINTAESHPGPVGSSAKIEANRRNAQRSTGPRTERGKAVSRWNRLRHGAYSKKLSILEGKHLPEYEEYSQLLEDLSPLATTPEAGVDCDVFVTTAWRLRTATAYEFKESRGAANRMGAPTAYSGAVRYMSSTFSQFATARKRIAELRSALEAAEATDNASGEDEGLSSENSERTGTDEDEKNANTSGPEKVA